VATCFGIYSNNTEVCGGNGNCLGPDYCDCTKNAKYDDCTVTIRRQHPQQQDPSHFKTSQFTLT
jgi:hypothetical protein